MHPTFRVARLLLGWFLAVFGTWAFLVSLYAVFDPVGAKMADDNDPLGRPDPLYVAAAIAAVYLAAALLGFWLALRKPRAGKGAV